MLEMNVENKMDRWNKECWSFSKDERRKIKFKHFKTGRHSWTGHTVGYNEFVVNILEGAISGKKAVGKPRLQYVKQVAKNKAAYSYTAMKRTACNNSRWKAANPSKDWRIIRRRHNKFPSSCHYFAKHWIIIKYCLDLIFRICTLIMEPCSKFNNLI